MLAAGIMKGKLFLRALCACCLVLPFFLSGCDDELVERIVGGVHHNPRTLSAIVYPPWPYDAVGEELMSDIYFAERVKLALSRGVADFNRVSRGTTVKAWFHTDADSILSFYDEFLRTAGKDRGRAECVKQLTQFNARNYGENAQIIIYGVMSGKKTAENVTIKLYLYDAEVGMSHSKIGDISRGDLLQMESNLRQLMKALLEDVYGR